MTTLISPESACGPHPNGYGVSVTATDSVLCAGGGDAKRHYADVFRLHWTGSALESSTAGLPPLPRPCAFMSGALVGTTLYLAGGIETPDATTCLNTFWALDVSHPDKGWRELDPNPCPGGPRMLAVAGTVDDSFYLFSGTRLSRGKDGKPVREYLKDAWRFTPANGWKRLSEACYIPAGLALIADYHRGPTRSFATGVHMVGIYVGALGGLGGFFAQHCGWHFAFRLFGAFGVVYGAILIAFLRDAKAVPARDPRQPETAQPQPPLPAIGEVRRSSVLNYQPENAGRNNSFLSILLTLLRSPAFLLLLFINVLVGAANWGINGWLSVFIRDTFQLDMTQAGLYATVPVQIASFVGVLSAAALSDRWAQTNRAARACPYLTRADQS